METEKKSNGAMMGLVIIIIILIIGGIYFWKNNTNKAIAPADYQTPPVGTNSAPSTNTNDSTKIEADLNGLDIESLDNGI